MYTTSDIRSSCRIVPGLSREQLDLCYKAHDVTIAALDGLDLAMRECQLQVSCISIYFILTQVNYHTHCIVLLNEKKPNSRNIMRCNFFLSVSVASLELFIT